MAMKKTAREYLVETARQLLSSRRVEDITVSDILTMSGVSHTTFYKHFRDKQALVAQVFIEELSNLFFYDVERPLYDREVDILKSIDANRDFYRNALKSLEFVQTWMEKAYDSNDVYMQHYLASHGVAPRILKLLAFNMSHTMAQAAMEWARSRPEMEPEEYARVLVNYLWGGLRAFAENPEADAFEGPGGDGEGDGSP